MQSEEKSQPLEVPANLCILPWIHMNVWPSGMTTSCCQSYNPVGNANDTPLDELINSSVMKTLRKEMLENKRPAWCSSCYRADDVGAMSHRRFANENFGSHYPKIKNTSASGELTDFEMVYWDMRFSNLCNFRCRTCGSDCSNSWYQEAPLVEDNYVPRENPERLRPSAQLFPQLKRHLPHVEFIYLLGGEPLLENQLWQVLDLIKEANLQEKVYIRINTNLSNLRFKDRNLLDILSGFTRTEITTSIDGIHERGEFIRKGMNWKNTVSNMQQLQQLKTIKRTVNSVVSILNAFHLPELITELLTLKLVEPKNLILSVLRTPHHYALTVLPASYKQAITEKYKDFIAELKENHPGTEWIQTQIDYAIAEMNAYDHSHLLPKFKKITLTLDQSRGESFTKLFPEYETMFT